MLGCAPGWFGVLGVLPAGWWGGLLGVAPAFGWFGVLGEPGVPWGVGLWVAGPGWGEEFGVLLLGVEEPGVLLLGVDVDGDVVEVLVDGDAALEGVDWAEFWFGLVVLGFCPGVLVRLPPVESVELRSVVRSPGVVVPGLLRGGVRSPGVVPGVFRGVLPSPGAVPGGFRGCCRRPGSHFRGAESVFDRPACSAYPACLAYGCPPYPELARPVSKQAYSEVLSATWGSEWTPGRSPWRRACPGCWRRGSSPGRSWVLASWRSGRRLKRSGCGACPERQSRWRVPWATSAWPSRRPNGRRNWRETGRP
ncbi:hypothetical protein QQM39_10725 [Streptomyces sp. DT2A-34]|uniref:hypothetical protein n=1 Tax=Streptomyces sp. DT2A-34 TaxID=3051182 RepID=UPI00265B8911|nr:hypothetical protein [Streptomyces sp. DT2A-34]MDO0911308.1 hypothetical protein [Streptomyces sp. DT2A-34]